MVTYNSYIVGKLVLSVIDSSKQMADRNGIPVTESEIPVDSAEARSILQRWMSLLVSVDPDDEIVLSYSGCNFTTEGVTQLSKFTSLDLVSSRVVASRRI